jgi:hypothetical protein
MAIEHDIIRPWKCCKKCRNEYERKRRIAEGRPTPVDRLRDGTVSAKNHDDKIDMILEVLRCR